MKKAGPKTEVERRAWLKDTHKLGTNYAWWIAERAEGKGGDEDNPDAYLRAGAEVRRGDVCGQARRAEADLREAPEDWDSASARTPRRARARRSCRSIASTSSPKSSRRRTHGSIWDWRSVPTRTKLPARIEPVKNAKGNRITHRIADRVDRSGGRVRGELAEEGVRERMNAVPVVRFSRVFRRTARIDAHALEKHGRCALAGPTRDARCRLAVVRCLGPGDRAGQDQQRQTAGSGRIRVASYVSPSTVADLLEVAGVDPVIHCLQQAAFRTRATRIAGNQPVRRTPVTNGCSDPGWRPAPRQVDRTALGTLAARREGCRCRPIGAILRA